MMMWNPFPPVAGKFASHLFVWAMDLAILATIGFLVGWAMHVWGFVGMLNVGWCVVLALLLVSCVCTFIYKFSSDDAEPIFRFLMLVGVLGSFGLSMLLILGEVVLYLSNYLGMGWAVASVLLVWSFPPTHEITKGLLCWFVIWFGDMIMVWMDSKSKGICHRVADCGWGLFWARGTTAKRLLKRQIEELNWQIVTNINYQKVARPRRTMSGGWFVPPEGVEFVYEGLMHDPLDPQPIENIVWLQERLATLESL